MKKVEEKAQEIIEIFVRASNDMEQPTTWEYDKYCAILFIRELIDDYRVKRLTTANKSIQFSCLNRETYWMNVLEEVEKQ